MTGLRIALTSVHCWPDVRRGGERYVHELAAALVRAGHAPTVLSTGRPGRDVVLGAPVRRLPVRRLPRFGELGVEGAFGAQALAHLAGPVLRGRYDAWHATSTSDAAAATLFAGRLPTVFTDHGFPARRSRAARPDRRLHQRVVDRIGSYVCVSGAAGALLQEDFGRPAVVVPPGVRLDEHGPLPRDPRPTLLYAGSLTESRKGVAGLLAAAVELQRTVPSLQVWLAGAGHVDAPDVVTHQGLLDDASLRETYARAWVTVLPSRAESFGMTLVESMASGTPVVARADGGGPSEVVVPGTGVLAAASEPSDEVGVLVDALAAALDLAQAPATVEACRARAHDFDWDAAVVPRLLPLYERAS